MRRALVVLATAATFAVGVAGPATAGPPRETGDKDCRPGTQCLSLKTGWVEPPGRRNVGG